MRNIFFGIALTVMIFCNAAFATHPNGAVLVDINGLVCDFCARALEKVFGKQEEVESITVDLDEKIVTIHFHEGQHLDDEVITNHINDAGYSVEKIRHEL